MLKRLGYGGFLLYRVDMKRALYSPIPWPFPCPPTCSPSEPSLVVILGVDRGDAVYAIASERWIDGWVVVSGCQ